MAAWGTSSVPETSVRPGIPAGAPGVVGDATSVCPLRMHTPFELQYLLSCIALVTSIVPEEAV